MLGTYALSSGYYDAYYLKALKVRNLIRGDFVRAFERCDCIMMPVAPTTAFKIGEKVDDPLKMYLADIYTVAVNLAGFLASVLRVASTTGLPIGLQILTPASARPSCCGSPGCTRLGRTGTPGSLREV
jgi:aspartyl-tRNA(Asn)/glutamyl-tRNA(Gln) amidotransferase subunit A